MTPFQNLVVSGCVKIEEPSTGGWNALTAARYTFRDLTVRPDDFNGRT